MLIEILNWDKFNPRRDVSKASWFRLNHDIFDNPDFFDFTHTDLACWIYLLTVASKKGSAKVTINPQHLERIGRIRLKDFHVALEKLKFIQCVHVDYTDTSRARNADVTPTCSTNERNETNVTNETGRARDPRPSPDLDFEVLYSKYPRKEKKTQGIARLKREIKNLEDYALCAQAIDNYARRKVGTEAKYLMQFSTFAGEWRDWLDPGNGTGPPVAEAIDWAKVFGEKKNAG